MQVLGVRLFVMRLCRVPCGKPQAFRQAENSLAATPPEAEPLFSKIANGKPEAFRIGGGTAANPATV